jgi:hypothetical protein
VDPAAGLRLKAAGIVLGLVGLSVAVVTLANAIAAGTLADRSGEETTVAALSAWSFGLTTTAFAFAKVGIAVVLAGIVIRIWGRIDAVKSALPALKAEGDAGPIAPGSIETPYGPASVSADPAKPLFVHRMAKTLWAPMLVMGGMAVVAGLAVSIAQANTVASDAALARTQSAWVQGLQFLGEAMLLGGISFLLGTVLYALRTGGGEVQASVGVPVKSLRMPTTGKLFVALMMLGMMVAIGQFVGYVVVATIDRAETVAIGFAWLGPVREFSLGLLLTGIVLALATIARVIGFQLWRLRDIVATGR